MPSPQRTKQIIEEQLQSIVGATELATVMAGRRVYLDNAHENAADTAENGTIDAPCATLAYAVGLCGAGDTVVTRIDGAPRSGASGLLRSLRRVRPSSRLSRP